LVEKIFICGITPFPPNRELAKTALGATESVDWEYFPDTSSAISTLKNLGYYIVGVEQTDQSIMLNDFKPEAEARLALVFGNEVTGLSDTIMPLLDESLEIPQQGTKHSLNVSVAAGIVLFHIASGILART
jgi:tRNA G18 (ribose-2'-O)-methylase SpoU